MNFGTRIGDLIGSGSNGNVYKLEDLIYDKGTGKKYVIKTVDKYIKDIKERIEECKRDIEMYKRKKNRNNYKQVIKELEDYLTEYNEILYYQMNPSKKTGIRENILLKEIMIQGKAGDLGIAPKVLTWNRDGNSFIMEYIDGMTLSNYLESNDLDSVDKLELKDSLEKLVSTLHHNNIYHNDLNPDNILITRDHRIYIIDYGLSTEYPIDAEDNACSEDDENLSDNVDLKYINELIDND